MNFHRFRMYEIKSTLIGLTTDATEDTNGAEGKKNRKYSKQNTQRK